MHKVALKIQEDTHENEMDMDTSDYTRNSLPRSILIIIKHDYSDLGLKPILSRHSSS